MERTPYTILILRAPGFAVAFGGGSGGLYFWELGTLPLGEAIGTFWTHAVATRSSSPSGSLVSTRREGFL